MWIHDYDDVLENQELISISVSLSQRRKTLFMIGYRSPKMPISATRKFLNTIETVSCNWRNGSDIIIRAFNNDISDSEEPNARKFSFYGAEI